MYTMHDLSRFEFCVTLITLRCCKLELKCHLIVCLFCDNCSKQISQLVSDVQHLQVTQNRLKESGANEVKGRFKMFLTCALKTVH